MMSSTMGAQNQRVRIVVLRRMMVPRLKKNPIVKSMEEKRRRQNLRRKERLKKIHLSDLTLRLRME